MRRYSYIIETNRITSTTSIRRYKSTDGISRTADILIDRDNMDYRFCLNHSPGDISEKDVTAEYYEKKHAEVEQQRAREYAEKVDKITAEIKRREYMDDIDEAEKAELIVQITELSNEIRMANPYPVMPV